MVAEGESQAANRKRPCCSPYRIQPTSSGAYTLTAITGWTQARVFRRGTMHRGVDRLSSPRNVGPSVGVHQTVD
jgi:hypothetical protein